MHPESAIAILFEIGRVSSVYVRVFKLVTIVFACNLCLEVMVLSFLYQVANE